MSQRALKIIIGLILGLTANAFIDAQFLPNTSVVSLSASVSSPSPDQTITIASFTPAINKNTAFFSWTIDGSFQSNLSGTGKDSISLAVGDVGSVTTVSLTVTSADDKKYSASLSIPVSDIAIAWSADTYIPQWYKGKALPTPRSTVTLVAVPAVILNGSAVSPEKLIYTWNVGDQTKFLSGIGENVLKIRLSEFPRSSLQIRLVVEDARGKIRTEKQAFIISREPQIEIYPATPLGGIQFESASKTVVTRKGAIIDLEAEPFFYPIRLKRDLSYQWNLGGVSMDAGTQPYLFSIDTRSWQEGALPITVSVGGQSALVPRLSKTFSVFIQ